MSWSLLNGFDFIWIRWTPLSSMIWPRKRIEFWESLHFSTFKVRLDYYKHLKNFLQIAIMFRLSFPWIRMLSMRQTTPVTPLRIVDICRWKCSGAEEMPKLKQYRPYGEIKVVSRANSRERAKSWLASKVENTVAPASCARVCSWGVPFPTSAFI